MRVVRTVKNESHMNLLVSDLEYFGYTCIENNYWTKIYIKFNEHSYTLYILVRDYD